MQPKLPRQPSCRWLAFSPQVARPSGRSERLQAPQPFGCSCPLKVHILGACVCVWDALLAKSFNFCFNSKGCQRCLLDWQQQRRQQCICDASWDANLCTCKCTESEAFVGVCRSYSLQGVMQVYLDRHSVKGPGGDATYHVPSARGTGFQLRLKLDCLH